MAYLTKDLLFKFLLRRPISQVASILDIEEQLIVNICDEVGIPIPDESHYILMRTGRMQQISLHKISKPNERIQLSVTDAQHWVIKTFGKPDRVKSTTLRRTRALPKPTNGVVWTKFKSAYERWVTCKDMHVFVDRIQEQLPVDEIINRRSASEWIEDLRTEIDNHNPIYEKFENLFDSQK